MASEAALDVFNLLRQKLGENGLDEGKLVAFTADNATANFGGVRTGTV